MIILFTGLRSQEGLAYLVEGSEQNLEQFELELLAYFQEEIH